MSLRSDSKAFSRLRSVVRKNFGDHITLICNGLEIPIVGRFEKREDIEFFEEMRAKSRHIHVYLHCDEMLEKGITVGDLSAAFVGVDSKAGEVFYKVENVLEYSITEVKLLLGACSNDVRSKTASKRTNRTKNRGRVREPLARCYVNRGGTSEDL